jgi:hypothetical protein
MWWCLGGGGGERPARRESRVVDGWWMRDGDGDGVVSECRERCWAADRDTDVPGTGSRVARGHFQGAHKAKRTCDTSPTWQIACAWVQVVDKERRLRGIQM